MKPAWEPASRRPKPCVSLKTPHESCPFAAPCGPRSKKDERGQTSAFPSPGSSTIELLSTFAEPGAYLPDKELPGSSRQCSLPLACCHPPQGHQIGACKRRTHRNTILSRPYRHRVSTDRPSREGSQLAASLGGGPGPKPAGKTLPHSYPEIRFRRERARPYTRRKDPPTLIPRNQASEGEGTEYLLHYFINLEMGIQKLVHMFKEKSERTYMLLLLLLSSHQKPFPSLLSSF